MASSTQYSHRAVSGLRPIVHRTSAATPRAPGPSTSSRAGHRAGGGGDPRRRGVSGESRHASSCARASPGAVSGSAPRGSTGVSRARLAARPPVDEYRSARDLPSRRIRRPACTQPVPGRLRGWEDQARAVELQPALPPMTAAFIGVRHRLAGGRLPWVATVSGLRRLRRRGHRLATRGRRLECRRARRPGLVVPGRRRAVVRIRTRAALVLLGPRTTATMTP